MKRVSFLLLILLSFPVLLGAAAKPELDIWNDPVFQKSFVAGYGFNSDIEPRVSPEEVEILEKIRPIMAKDVARAEGALRGKVTPECSAVLDFTLGGIYFQQDKMKEALKCYQNAVKKYPNFRRAWRNIGLINVRSGDHDNAITAFTRMIELGGGDAYSYGLLGFAYAIKQDYQAAEQAFRNALLLQPQNTEWRLGITRCAFKQLKFEDAVTQLEVLIGRYPEKPDFWLLQAQAYLGMKQPLKAAEDLESVDRLGKSTVDSLHTLGDIYLSENLADSALNAYSRAFKLDTKQQLYRPVRSAEMLAMRGAPVEARKLLDQITQARTADIPEADRRKILKLQARLSMAEGGGGEDAVKALEEIVKLDPLDGEALMLLGQHYIQKNEPDRAIFYFERAEGIEQFEAKAKIRHAQVFVGMGRFNDALPLLRRAQELKPQEEVARYLEQVERAARTRR
jgi:tetratricopeptide (TPR) repeat protein